jgi:hypothetical protein
MGFLDWLDDLGGGGGTAWETSYTDAVEQALTWIDQVANAKNWTDAWRTKAYGIVEDAQWDAGNQVGDTLTVAFWRELTKQWSNASDGWNDLWYVWDSASDAAYDPVAQTVDNVEETVKDIVNDTTDIINPKKSPWPWIAGGLVGLFLLREFRR